MSAIHTVRGGAAVERIYVVRSKHYSKKYVATYEDCNVPFRAMLCALKIELCSVNKKNLTFCEGVRKQERNNAKADVTTRS